MMKICVSRAPIGAKKDIFDALKVSQHFVQS